MQIKPFRIEHYYGKYEFSARYLLSSSDAESRSIRELLELEPGATERLLNHWCGYTESPGAPYLREAVAAIYGRIAPEEVLVLSCAEEAILVVNHALLGAGDHAIVETPCFESALELARSTGAEVSQWQRVAENGWSHDLNALQKLIRPNTRMLYVTTPHNPTGLLMPRHIFDSVIEICRKHGLLLFCDEVYRELEHDPATRLPAACDAYERGISLGSMSKTYGLPGLRLGWLATHQASALRRCLEFKYYTTICSSAPSEFLADVALRHRQALINRNLQIIRRNLPLLDAFFARRADIFDWVRPDASPTGFVRFHPKRDVMEFCEDLVRKAGVLLLPGTVYDQPRHIRFGYGRQNMPEALGHLEKYLES